MYIKKKSFYTVKMLSNVFTIESKNLYFFDDLKCLYSLSHHSSAPILVIPTISYNNKYYSLIKNINNQDTQSSFHSIICIKTCQSKSDIIHTFLNYFSISSNNIYKTISCYKVFFSQIDNNQFLKDILIHFSEKNSIEQLHKIRKICKLKPKLIHFCEVKNFSFKQLYHLTLIQPEIITLYLDNADYFHFSARYLDELLTLTSDTLNRNEHTLSSIIDIISSVKSKSSLSPQQKTNQLKTQLIELAYPTLTQKNKELDNLANTIPKNKNINLNWDRTLENKGVNLNITLTKDKDIDTLLSYLNNNKKNIINLIKET